MKQDRLTHLESLIVRKQEHFCEIGRALKEIRDHRLYKLALFETFAADIISALDPADGPSSKRIFATLVSRLRSWQEFMKRAMTLHLNYALIVGKGSRIAVFSDKHKGDIECLTY